MELTSYKDEPLVRRVRVPGSVPPGRGELHQDLRPPHLLLQGDTPLIIIVLQSATTGGRGVSRQHGGSGGPH